MYLTPTNMHGITILLNTYIHLNAYTCTVLSLYNSAACSPLCPRLSKINPVSSFLCLLQRVSVLIRTTAHFPHFPHLNMHQFDYLYIFFKNDPFHFFSVYEIFLDTVHKLKGKHCVSITYCLVLVQIFLSTNSEWLLEKQSLTICNLAYYLSKTLVHWPLSPVHLPVALSRHLPWCL